MSVDLEIIGDLAGYTISLLISLALIGGVLYLQWYEFRHWQHSKLSFWLLKLATPVAGVLIVLFSLMLGSGVEGLEALAFFYGGILAALVGAPFLMIALGKLFGVPPPDTMRAAASVVLLFVVLWFSGASAFNSLTLISSTDYEDRREYLSFERGDESGPDTTDEVQLVRHLQWRLPDGKRLIYIEFQVDPTLVFRRFQVQMDRQWGSGESWGGLNGGCITPGHYHVTNVIDKAEFMDVRLVVHEGTAETLRVFRDRVEFPDTDDAIDGYFQIFSYNGELTFPVPLPASRITLVQGDVEINLQDDVPGRTPRQYKGVHANRDDCLEPTIMNTADHVKIALHAEELYAHLYYRFKPRNVAPEFR